MPQRRPNILFLFADQQRWDTLGCYGQPLPLTPNLDRLAAEGVRFANCFSNQPVCGPCRSMLQTGRYPTEIGCHVNHRMLPPGLPTIAQSLRWADYEPAYLGKWHLASQGAEGGTDDFRTRAVPMDRRGGYDGWWLAADVLEFTSHGYDGHMFDGEGRRREFPQNRYRADAQTDWLLEWLDGYDGSKPFFHFCSWIEPHHQNDSKCHEGPHGSRERFRDFVVPGDLLDRQGDWREQYPDYLGCIHSLDQNVGRIRVKLAERGLDRDTIIIYTSDHGSHFRTRNREYKRSCHEASIHVPLIVQGPGCKPGQVREELTALIDLPRTVLDLASAEALPAMRGRSLRPLLEGRQPPWRDEVLVQISESQCGRALRTGRWKYGVTARDSGPMDPADRVYVEQYLYDLELDPHECSNLVAHPFYAGLRQGLARRLEQVLIDEAGEAPAQVIPLADSRS